MRQIRNRRGMIKNAEQLKLATKGGGVCGILWSKNMDGITGYV